ncbi:hypothetical protein M231_00102 [Tremella mesenterica]|uniref:Uncharacterized protein n=1 Tax=Tremella mesenterica TaxID=5217 RepID=A0A4Q1BWM0_TREME|nr:hypothetical protein M231_00102 [Tremella mesenterica]
MSSRFHPMAYHSAQLPRPNTFVPTAASLSSQPLMDIPSVIDGHWTWQQIYGDSSLSSRIPHDSHSTDLDPGIHVHQSTQAPAHPFDPYVKPSPQLPLHRLEVLPSRNDDTPARLYHPQQRYPQPAWNVYSNSDEHIRETRAARTSRHLRESSEKSGRGQSVSPPPIPPRPIDSPKYERPFVPLGPRQPRRVTVPLPSQSTSITLEPTPNPTSHLSEIPVTPPRYIDLPYPSFITPSEVLSPAPKSYVGYFGPPSPHRLSPGTVRSLEALVDDDALATLVRSAGWDLGIDKTLPPPPVPTKKMEKERPSIFGVFDGVEQRPGIRTRKSEEKRVRVVEHVRIPSVSGELHDHFVTEGEDLLADGKEKVEKIGTGTGSGMLKVLDRKEGDGQLSKQGEKAGLQGSARGGRGGKVTMVREVWSNLNDNASVHPPSTIELQTKGRRVSQGKLKTLIEKYEKGFMV